MLAAGNRGVCCGGSCGFPEETGEEQEVLLRTEGGAAALPAQELWSGRHVGHVGLNLSSVDAAEALRWGGIVEEVVN